MGHIIATFDATEFVSNVSLFLYLHGPLVRLLAACLVLFLFVRFLKGNPERTTLSIAVFLLFAAAVVLLLLFWFGRPARQHLLPTEEPHRIQASPFADLA